MSTPPTPTTVTIDQAMQIAVEHHRAGRLREAEAIYRQVLAQQPNHDAATHSLAILAGQVGRFDVAVDLMSRLAHRLPNQPEILVNLGEFYRALGRYAESADAARRALQLRPDYPEACNNLGLALTQLGQLDEAIAHIRRGIELWAAQNRPPADAAGMHANLGNALRLQRHLAEALACYQRAVQLSPQHAIALACLGGALKELGRLDEAVAALRRAIALQPNLPEAHNNLGITLGAAGDAREAIACFDAALALQPQRPDFRSNRLYSLAYLPETAPRTLLHEAREWNRVHAALLLPPMRPHANDRASDRRLRVGYVSADFCNHPVTAFFLPLLQHHDPQQVEIHCYSGTPAPDAFTAKVRGLAHHWRDTTTVSDEALAEQIRADRIDILVDLALHTHGNRLLVFARKPAPIQLTWLGYAGTTGLEAMDYRITDAYLDPPGSDENYAEKSLRLAHCFWCYQPLIETPPVNPLPALQNGRVTFGCLNNFAKVSTASLEMWMQVLAGVPNSRLLLNYPPGSHRENLRQRFAAAGIDPARIEFTQHGPIEAYYRHYHEIDIALDPFPYGGGTTTCDALWMGVPVVTLSGQTAVSRAGRSILSNGLDPVLLGLIAHTPDEYVEIAVRWAGDLGRLAGLRDRLRETLQVSPLMDAGAFAADMEKAYREMWRTWCMPAST